MVLGCRVSLEGTGGGEGDGSMCEPVRFLWIHVSGQWIMLRTIARCTCFPMYEEEAVWGCACYIWWLFLLKVYKFYMLLWHVSIHHNVV